MGLALSIKTRVALYSATIEAVSHRSPKVSGRSNARTVKVTFVNAHKFTRISEGSTCFSHKRIPLTPICPV